MRIAQVSPLYENVPPKYYGGTERVVSYLTEELVAMGHEVTLYATGESNTQANLVSVYPCGLRMDPQVIDPMSLHYFMLELVAKDAFKFDIIHFHVDYLHFMLSRRASYRHVTTLHGRLDIPELIQLHEEYCEMPLISISEAQRQPVPDCNWVATVHHGLPLDLYKLNPQPQQYLAFLGRVSPEKRLDRAIQIAELSGMHLKIAAKVDNADKAYYDSTIKPLLKHTSSIEFLGEISDRDKQDFLGNALALLFPIDWPEPFGLVMIEAIACGTPVIAFPQGSVSEIIDEGKSGYLVSNVMEAIEAVQKVNSISRRGCRDIFESRFSVRTMANNYLDSYAAALSSDIIEKIPSLGVTLQ